MFKYHRAKNMLGEVLWNFSFTLKRFSLSLGRGYSEDYFAHLYLHIDVWRD